MIHESAYVEKAEIGEGTNIWHFVHIRKDAKIGCNCNIGKGVYVDTKVVIGDNCKIQNFATLYQGLSLEDDVFIGPHVCFTNDVYPRAKIWGSDKIVNTLVRKGASVGANSTIIAGIIIGKNAIIGAGSLVAKDVPDHALVYGNPARIHGYVCECGHRLNKKEKDTDKELYYCEKCDKEIILNL